MAMTEEVWTWEDDPWDRITLCKVCDEHSVKNCRTCEWGFCGFHTRGHECKDGQLQMGWVE